MDAEEPVDIYGDDDIDQLVDLLERAEMSLRNGNDNKYYVTLDELFLLASQQDLDREPRVELDCGGHWVIEVYYSKIIFIHVTSYQGFVGESVH